MGEKRCHNRTVRDYAFSGVSSLSWLKRFSATYPRVRQKFLLSSTNSHLPSANPNTLPPFTDGSPSFRPHVNIDENETYSGANLRCVSLDG